MLVIRRRTGESLLIGDEIEVEILELSAGNVKIGIRAPREVTVLRKEIHLTQQQNRAASGGVSAEVLGELFQRLRQ